MKKLNLQRKINKKIVLPDPLEGIISSPFIALLGAKKKNIRADLCVGQPDFDVPNTVKNEAMKMIRSGFNRYTATQGIKALRDKISKKLMWENNVFMSPDNILVTAGTTGAILLLYLSLLRKGDEVIISSPYFPVYIDLLPIIGAKARIVQTDNEHQLNIKAIKRTINSHTKLIVINSPNNPTGAVYGLDSIKQIVALAQSKNIPILSDEIYEIFNYEEKHISPASLYENVFTLNGFSKTYGMTGWRIGYIAGPEKAIKRMSALNLYSFVCAPSFAQYAACKALELNMIKTVTVYRRKRNLLSDGIKDYYNFVKPKGAFYLFLEVPTGETDLSFTKKAEEHGLAVIPGRVFDATTKHVRLSFATSDQTIRLAISILKKMSNKKEA